MLRYLVLVLFFSVLFLSQVSNHIAFKLMNFAEIVLSHLRIIDLLLMFLSLNHKVKGVLWIQSCKGFLLDMSLTSSLSSPLTPPSDTYNLTCFGMKGKLHPLFCPLPLTPHSDADSHIPTFTIC